jgi:hypothetical protein
MGVAKGSIQRRQPDTVIRKGLAEFLPTSVQKTYFMLSVAERSIKEGTLDEFGAAMQVDPANARLAAHSVSGLTLKRHC